MTQKIKLTFLGTADSIPSAKRNHTAILLTFDGENILIDCGEGTQRQFRKARLNPCKVTRLLITHWHADHVLGLPGLFQTLALSGYPLKMQVYGPKGTKNFMKNFVNVFVSVLKFKADVFEVEGKFFENENFYLKAEKMEHGIPCNAYCFVKKGQIRIDKKKLARAKLGSGVFLQKLKQGKNISYKGKKYLAKDLTYKEEDKKICVVLDTKMNNKIVSFVKDSDLLICESSFESELKERANNYNHLTATQAAEIAKKAKVKKLILTHISGRYEKNMKKILDEAKKVFKNTILASDLDVVEVE